MSRCGRGRAPGPARRSRRGHGRPGSAPTEVVTEDGAAVMSTCCPCRGSSPSMAVCPCWLPPDGHGQGAGRPRARLTTAARCAPVTGSGSASPNSSLSMSVRGRSPVPLSQAAAAHGAVVAEHARPPRLARTPVTCGPSSPRTATYRRSPGTPATAGAAGRTERRSPLGRRARAARRPRPRAAWPPPRGRSCRAARPGPAPRTWPTPGARRAGPRCS